MASAWIPTTTTGPIPGSTTGPACSPARACRCVLRTKMDMFDVYQATTQMTDESGQTYPFTIDTLLEQALGRRAITAFSPPTCTPMLALAAPM